MQLTDKLGEIFNFSVIEIFKDKKTLSYLAILTVVLTVLNACFNMFSVSMFLPLTKAGTASTAELAMMLLAFFGFMGVLYLLTYIVSAVAEYLAIARAFEIKGITPRNFTLVEFLKYILLTIVSGLAALLSIYRLKFLVMGIIGAVLLIAGIVLFAISSVSFNMPLLALGGLLVVLGIIVLLVYFVVVFINSIRLSVCNASFLANTNRGIMESLKDSWTRTEGATLDVFLITLIMGIVFGAISMVLSVPILGFTMAGSMAQAFSASGQTVIPAYLGDPWFNILSIFSYLGAAIAVVGSGFMVAIIYQMLGNKNETLLGEEASKAVEKEPIMASSSVAAEPRRIVAPTRKAPVKKVVSKRR